MLSSKAFFLLGLTSLVVGCSTYYKPADTLYWSGKDDVEFFERKRYPDTTFRCIKDNKVSYIHGYMLALYDLNTYEVGRNANTIFMTTEKHYTGGYDWTYLFTDENHKITSVRNATGFGEIEKEFKCNEYEETYKPELKPRLWTAVAVRSTHSKQGIWGNDTLYQNLDDAKKEAIDSCEKESGETCEFLFGFSNMCLTLAHADKIEPTSYIGVGIIGKDSKENALKNCKDDGASNCHVPKHYPVCSTPCDYSKDKQCFFDKPPLAKPGKNGKDEIFYAGEKNLF